MFDIVYPIYFVWDDCEVLYDYRITTFYSLWIFYILGIYIKADRDDVNPKYRGIGIRIEDNILITKSKPVVLTQSCPKHPDEIERLMLQWT